MDEILKKRQLNTQGSKGLAATTMTGGPTRIAATQKFSKSFFALLWASRGGARFFVFETASQKID